MSSKIGKKSIKKDEPKIESTKSDKIGIVRLTEADKAADTTNYILNPQTNKHVKRDSQTGEKLEEGDEIPKTLTETERLILIIKTLQEEIKFSDETIKKTLSKLDDKILPRSFPAAWGGKHKAPRDPAHPKPPKTSYIFFTTAIRPKVALDNPNLSNTEIVALMAEMWGDTKAKNRLEYEVMATKDKERYESQMKTYETEYPDKARASTKAQKKHTKATAHRMFCDENRQRLKDDNPELGGREIITMLSGLWNEIKEDPEQLAKYQELANEANEGVNALTQTETPIQILPSPKKFSPAEQAKADQPDKYELNIETGRHVLKKHAELPISPKETKKIKKPNLKEKASKAKRTPKPEIIIEIERGNEDDK